MDLNKVKININFEIPISWFFGIWLILGGIVSVAIYYTSTQEESILRIVEAAKFFLIVAGAGFVAVTVYCQWKTLFLNVKQMEYQTNFEKKRLALELLMRWDSDYMETKRVHYRKFQSERKNKSEKEIVALINKETDYRNSVLDMANYFEDVCQAIRNDIADEEMLKYGLQPLLQTIKKTYDPWFKHLKKDDPEVFEHYKPYFELLTRWR